MEGNLNTMRRDVLEYLESQKDLKQFIREQPSGIESFQEIPMIYRHLKLNRYIIIKRQFQTR